MEVAIRSLPNSALLLGTPGHRTKGDSAFPLLYFDVPSFGNTKGLEGVARKRQATAFIDRSRATER